MDLKYTGFLLEINNEVVATATGAAELGHPARAVSLLASWMHSEGKSFKKGRTVLSGGQDKIKNSGKRKPDFIIQNLKELIYFSASKH